MGLKDEIDSEITKILAEQWSERDGTVVPESDNLKLSNDGIWLDATVLYADMADSTRLVDNYKTKFAAEIYKSFLHSAAKIIRSENGEITAYDGDRIMAVFIGDAKNTAAARAAFKINYSRIYILNPLLKAQYPKTTYQLNHVVGIDTSKVFVSRTGIRGSNDLVWVGRAANHAAKLSALSHDFPTRIASDVYNQLNHSMIFSNGKNMWEEATWTDMQTKIYRSTWWWSI